MALQSIISKGRCKLENRKRIIFLKKSLLPLVCVVPLLFLIADKQ
jgi:hypothetical protein